MSALGSIEPFIASVDDGRNCRKRSFAVANGR